MDTLNAEPIASSIEEFTMPRAKQAAKRRAAKKTVPVLGAAGLSFALAGGAAATTSGPATDIRPMPNTAPNHEIILGEEEISDVSLATFHVFDKETAGTVRPRARFAFGCGGCGSLGPRLPG